MSITHKDELKSLVKDHWETETCGARYGISSAEEAYFDEIATTRYNLEPYIPEFARFSEARDLSVLEIGTGAGSDFYRWICGGAVVTGVDLTLSAIRLTRRHLARHDVAPDRYELHVADAENLPFDDGRFDLVYSYGVLHHTPNARRAFSEVFRVLKPGGTVRAMIYHVPSWAGLLLWIQHCLLKARPWLSMKYAIFNHLESPGTKSYTIREAREMLRAVGFDDEQLSTKLAPGDLLTMKPSAKYHGFLSRWIWKIYPRWFVRMFGDRFGTALLIEARKPSIPSGEVRTSPDTRGSMIHENVG